MSKRTCINDVLKIKFLKTLKTQSLWSREEALAIAVSGGIDSIVLLHLVLNLPKPHRPNVHVFHFEHGLRGKQSQAEAKFVVSLCQKWKTPISLGVAPVWKTKSNLHEQARRLRYDFFFEEAARNGIHKIATAHQANDQAETILMHWIQGAGLKGLSGIPFQRPIKKFLLVRPLLQATRAEIVTYAKENKLKHCEDPSNHQDKYLRTRLRALIHQLEKENPRFLERAGTNALLLQEDEKYLEEVVVGLFYEGVEWVGDQLQASLAFFRKISSRSLRYRFIQKMAHEACEEGLSFEEIAKIDVFLGEISPQETEATMSLPGMRLKRGKSVFYFSK